MFLCLKANSQQPLLALLLCHDPAVAGEGEGADEELGSAAVGLLVGVGDEVGVPVEVVHRAVAYTEVVLVGAIEVGAAALVHAAALTVVVGALDGARAAVDGLVGGALATATVVVADEEVVVLAALVDEGGLDGVLACLDRVATLDGEVDVLAIDIALAIAAGYGDGRGDGSLKVGLGEADELYAVPEGAVAEVGGATLVDDEVGVDGVPVVAPTV